MIEKYNIYLKAKEEALKEFENYINDKSISLDDRWNHFVELSEELGKREPYIQHFKTFNKPEFESKYRNKLEDKLYDDFNKYQNVITSNIVESIENYVESVGEEYIDDIFKLVTPELIIELKEEILESNMYSFEFDW